MSPVAGPSAGASAALRGEARGVSDGHDRSAMASDQDHAMEHQSGNHAWSNHDAHRQDPAEQGYLAPPLNYNNNNYPDGLEQEEQALSEPCSSASGGQGSAVESHHGEEGGQEVADLVVYRETGSHLSEADSKVQYLGGVKLTRLF